MISRAISRWPEWDAVSSMRCDRSDAGWLVTVRAAVVAQGSRCERRDRERLVGAICLVLVVGKDLRRRPIGDESSVAVEHPLLVEGVAGVVVDNHSGPVPLGVPEVNDEPGRGPPG